MRYPFNYMFPLLMSPFMPESVTDIYLCHFPAWITKVRPETANGCGNVKCFSKQLEQGESSLEVNDFFLLGRTMADCLPQCTSFGNGNIFLSQRKFQRTGEREEGLVSANVSDQLGARSFSTSALSSSVVCVVICTPRR